MDFFQLLDGRAAGRVRLRPAVHVAPVEHGLLIIGWQSRVIVSGGPALHRLWAALEPYLEAGVDLDELVGGLPEGARDVARALLARLDEADALVPANGAGWSAPSSRTVGRLVEFLASAAPDPAAALHAISTAVVAVRGAGLVAERAAALLLEHGVGEVHVSAEVGAAVSASAEHPEHGRLVVTSGQPCRLDVVVAVDDGSAGSCGPVAPEGAGAAEGAVQIDVVSTADRVLVLPPLAGGGARDATLAAMRRRGGDVRLGRAPRTVALVAAGHVVVQVIYSLAQITTETDGQAVSVSADRLRISHHPAWLPAGRSLVPVRTEDRVAYDPTHIARLTDELTGPLPEPLPGSARQTPFAVLTTTERGVLGHGTTAAAARYRASLESGRLLLAGEIVPDGDAVVAAGSDYSEFIVDGLSRVLARALSVGDPDGLLCDDVAPDLDIERPRVRAAVHRLATLVAADPAPAIAHHRLARDPSLASVVSARRGDGELVSLAIGTDPEDALVRALDHVVARAQAGGAGEAVPQLALGWSADEETRAWDGDLDLLARAVTGVPLRALHAGRVGEPHPIAGLGVLGVLRVAEVTP